MNDKKEKRRPKYNVLQNVGWMIARAWRKDRGVLGYSLLLQGFIIKLSEPIRQAKNTNILCHNPILGCFFHVVQLMDALLPFLLVAVGPARGPCLAYFYLIRMTLEGGLSAAEFLLYFSAFSGFSSWIRQIRDGDPPFKPKRLRPVQELPDNRQLNALDPTEGRVLLNGVDIRALNRREYYKLLSAVFQDFSLINITLAETVAQSVGRPAGGR